MEVAGVDFSKYKLSEIMQNYFRPLVVLAKQMSAAGKTLTAIAATATAGNRVAAGKDYDDKTLAVLKQAMKTFVLTKEVNFDQQLNDDAQVGRRCSRILHSMDCLVVDENCH